MYKIAIKRPIATLMYVMTLVIFGYMSFKNMPASLYPNIDFPIVTIKTIYPGAEPSTVESQITDKLEEAISSIDGIDSIRSSSSDGISIITVKFFLKRDIDEATNDVRDKVSAIRLPKNAYAPLVSKLDIGGAPVINLFLATKKSNLKELMLFADEKVKPALQKIMGVGNVSIIGYRDREIQIYPDLHALNKYGISILELNNAIERENIKIGGGKIITKNNEFILKIDADATTLDALREIPIKSNIKLSDIALIKDTLSDAKSYASLNGQQGVTLQVQKISGTNTIEVVKKVKALVPKLKKMAGEKFELKTLQDTTPFIINSLNDVKFDLIYGSILAAIIIFVFLRNFTITFVSALAIPSSIFGTFALMNYMGFNLNKMTLIGLTLAIGIIIDDAIVVIENIYKKMEEGMSKLEAAFEGTKEMAFAILAISAMLLAVFVPVGNMSGIVGKFFESFAMTVSFAIIISYTIALSFIPSISARVLHKKESRFYTMTESIFVSIDKIYEILLKKALHFKWVSLLLVLLVFVGSLSLFPKIGMDFLPKEDKSEFEIKIKADTGISLTAMINEAKSVESKLKEDKNILFTTLNVAYNNAHEINKALIYVKLSPKESRHLTQEEIIQKYRKKLKEFENKMFITVSAIPNIKGAGADVPFQIVLKSDSFSDLQLAKKHLLELLKKKKGFMDIDTNLDNPKPQYEIEILRQKTNRLSIPAIKIANLISTAFSSDLEISHFEENAKQYNITLRVSDKNRAYLQSIKKLQIRAGNGELVYLDGLIKIHKSYAQATIYHYDRERQVSIYADLFGLDLGSAVKYTQKHLKEILPATVSYRFTGFAEEMGKTNRAFAAAIGLSIILMFIILAILYESLIQPIIIMVALPLSIIGVMIALYLTHLHFSLFVMVGFMLLMGMVGKNAVLLVDFANSAMKAGKNSDDALLEAGEKRLRPILMTTFAMVFAMLPLAIGDGVGSETKAPMSISVIGGLLSSMVLTLFVVPVIYKLISPLDRWMRKFYEEKELK
jgi:HAE1 family hydrophobic/amphiphilic exporter-1